jgi:outer membrane protein assembly factor BamB
VKLKYGILLIVCIAQCAFGQEADVASNWNCFRGPKAGVSPWTNAPVLWDGASGTGVLWKTPLSIAGVSSPVLWEKRIFITEGNPTERAVLAFDAGDGRLRWRQVVADGGQGASLPPASVYGYAMPTPVCDSNGVYALFGTGDLAAFSPDGKPMWQMYLKRPTIKYGFASSPCIIKNLVCVQFDHETAGRVLAVETTTGQIKWNIERSKNASWSSLMVVPDADGKPLVVACVNGSTTAYDLTGRIAWDIEGATGEVTPSPAWWKGRVYSVKAGSKLFCHNVHGNIQKRWEYEERLSDTASPIVVNGLFFMATTAGELTCLDADTGKQAWAHQAPGGYASLVSSGDRVYVMGRDGTTLIVEAARTYREIGTCQLGDPLDSTPAMSDGRLYIRGSKWLWCIGNKPAGQP